MQIAQTMGSACEQQHMPQVYCARVEMMKCICEQTFPTCLLASPAEFILPMLCHAVLCCAVLRCAVLCYVASCYSVLPDCLMLCVNLRLRSALAQMTEASCAEPRGVCLLRYGVQSAGGGVSEPYQRCAPLSAARLYSASDS